MARALVWRRPDRIIWGSDWPRTPLHGRCVVKHVKVMPLRQLDTGKLLNILADWVPKR